MAQTNRVTKEDVERIADLARLALTDEELAAATEDLSNILNHFAAIGEIDTEGVATADDVTGLQNVMRDDAAEEEKLATHKQLLEAAPEQQNGHIKVRAIFK